MEGNYEDGVAKIPLYSNPLYGNGASPHVFRHVAVSNHLDRDGGKRPSIRAVRERGE